MVERNEEVEKRREEERKEEDSKQEDVEKRKDEDKERKEEDGGHKEEGEDEERKEEDEERKEEEEERKENIKREFEEKKRDLEEKKQQEIEKVHQWAINKKEYIKSGPHGIVKLYTSPIALVIAMLIDQAISLIPVAGSILGFFFNVAFWLPPFVLGGKFLSFIKVIIFYVGDLFLSLIGDAFDFFLYLGEILDVVPELSALTFMKSWSPANILLDGYKDLIPQKLESIDHRAQKKIVSIKKSTSDAELSLRKKLSGKLSFKANVSIEGKKIITFFFAMTILLMGPAGIFLPTPLPIISFSQSSITITLFVAVLLAMISAFGFMSRNHFIGLELFLLINGMLVAAFQNTEFIAKYLGGSTVVALALFILGSALYVGFLEGWVSKKAIGVITLLVFLLVTAPFMTSYVTSARFHSDVEANQLQASAQLQNKNFIQQFKDWFTQQKMMGSGDYIDNGGVEQTNEYIGVKIEGVEALQQEVPQGRPARIDVYYSANSYNPLKIMTICKDHKSGILGDVSPKFVEASETNNPTVKCLFNDLSKGPHVIDVQSLFNYETTTEIPLVFMDYDFAQSKLLAHKTAGGPSLEELIGSDKQSFVSSPGPIYISAGNARRDGKLIFKNPIVVDRETVNDIPPTITLQFPNTNPSGNIGGLQEVHSLNVALPPGVQLTNCNFGDGSLLPYTTNDRGEWVTFVDLQQVGGISSYKQIACDLHFDKSYIDDLIPRNPERAWSSQIASITVDYTYKLSNTGTMIRVV